jgi:hypothetical protein
MTGETMTTESTTEQARSETDRIDDGNIRGDQRVAWYARGDGELSYPLDTPVPIGEVYELVSVMLKTAPFDHLRPTEECVIETTNHRAWPGFFLLVLMVEAESGLYDEARSLW